MGLNQFRTINILYTYVGQSEHGEAKSVFCKGFIVFLCQKWQIQLKKSNRVLV